MDNKLIKTIARELKEITGIKATLKDLEILVAARIENKGDYSKVFKTNLYNNPKYTHILIPLNDLVINKYKLIEKN